MMNDYKREKYSPIITHCEFYSTEGIIQNKRIIKFYRTLFGLQISMVLIYYFYNLCV